MSVICLNEIRDRIKDIFQEANPSKQEHIARASETTKDLEEIRGKNSAYSKTQIWPCFPATSTVLNFELWAFPSREA